LGVEVNQGAERCVLAQIGREESSGGFALQGRVADSGVDIDPHDLANRGVAEPAVAVEEHDVVGLRHKRL